MYEDKPLKERPDAENIAPAAVEERAVDTPFDHNDDIESMQISINELEEALRCIKHELKQLKESPAQEPVVSAPALVEVSTTSAA